MKTIRLLTIGNSLADNALTYLKDLGRDGGRVRFEIARANLGGCPLHKHWNLFLYTEKHPEYKTYPLDSGTSGASGGTRGWANLQEALTLEPWDFVTINHASLVSVRRETYQPWLGLLHGLVRERAPRAGILLHQTWAYREDASYFPDNGLTPDLMYERIRANYAHFAAELGCRILPSGKAVQEARRAPGRAFTWPDPAFDYQHAEAPALPRQDHSLSVGWHWVINQSADGLPELRLDSNHLNAAGCYLIGCAWFECLTGLDAREIAFRPGDVDADTAALLRGTAHEVSRRYGPLPAA